MLCSIKKINLLEFTSTKALVHFILSFKKIKRADVYEYSGNLRLAIFTSQKQPFKCKSMENSYLEYHKTLEYGERLFSLNF